MYVTEWYIYISFLLHISADVFDLYAKKSFACVRHQIPLKNWTEAVIATKDYFLIAKHMLFMIPFIYLCPSLPVYFDSFTKLNIFL